MTQWTLVHGRLAQGYRVASGPSADYPYGALDRQRPIFAAHGLDLSAYFNGSLNVDIRPRTFRMVKPQFTFRHIEWTDLNPPEDFSLSRCRVVYKDLEYDGWLATWAQNQTTFGMGQAAMNTDSSNFVSTYEDPKKSKLAGKVGYAPVPRGPAGIKSTIIAWCLSIGSKSKQKEATWLFIQWLASKEMNMRQVKMKIPVGRQSAWKSKEYQSSMPKDWLDSFAKAIPTAAVNQANPLVVQVPETRDAIGKAIVAVIQGGNAREEAMKAQQECLKILKMS